MWLCWALTQCGAWVNLGPGLLSVPTGYLHGMPLIILLLILAGLVLAVVSFFGVTHAGRLLSAGVICLAVAMLVEHL